MGRLCQRTDAVGTTQYTYTAQGRIASRTETDGFTLGGGIFTLQYGYNSAGQRTSVTYPSGAVVNFTYNGNNQVASISVTLNGTTTPILSNATYEPFGAVRGWTWGNGATVIRSHNTDGNASVISSTGLHLSFQYDNALRTQNVSDLDTTALSWTYSYDVLDRLNAANDATNSESWTYDGNGNRITQTGNYGQASLLYNVNNNQFQPGTYYYPGQVNSGGYDAAGNPTYINGMQVVFDAEGNLDAQLIDLGATNGLRQRVASETGPVEQRIVYDDDGHIVGEYYYDAADYVPPLIPLEETIWLGDLPVATMMSTEQYDQNGNPTGLNTLTYYVHADQLGSPRRLTRPSDNQLVWRWDSDPFGFKFGGGDYTAAQSDPLGLGVYAVYNLRFPGQLRGPVVDTFYNWFRDYDPLSGRYLQSDPIGLKGESFSAYVYASNDSVMIIDRNGLQSIVSPNPPKASATSPLPTTGGPLGPIPKFPDSSNPGKCTGECTEIARKGTEQCHRTCWALPGGAALCVGAWVEWQEACVIHCATD